MKDLSEQTHYEVLELAPGCAADALLKAYALAKERYAPGALATYALAEPSEAEALLRRVEEAFAVLSDPDRRQAYDAASGYSSIVPEHTPARAPEHAPEQALLPAADPTLAPPTRAPEPEQAQPAVVSESAPLPSAAEPPPVTEPAVTEASVAEPSVAEPTAAEPTAAEPIVAEPARELAAAPEPVPVASVAAASVAAEPVHEPAPAPQQEPVAQPVAAKAEPKPPEPEHKPVRKTESELPADSAVTGEALRRVREARGLTLKDVESRTKIGRWHLENIERDRYADLPAQVYLRGFLMSLARELRLDPVRVARSYLEQMKAKPQAKAE